MMYKLIKDYEKKELRLYLLYFIRYIPIIDHFRSNDFTQKSLPTADELI